MLHGDPVTSCDRRYPPLQKKNAPPTLQSVLIIFQWAPPQNLSQGQISWSSCGPQLNRLASSGSNFSYTILVIILYVWEFPRPSIRPISQIALSKSLVDGVWTPSWFIYRGRCLRSPKQSKAMAAVPWFTHQVPTPGRT